MSKEAALRAMREAKYAARAAGPSAPAKPARPAVRPPVRTAATKAASALAAPPTEATDELCGHRSMNGRSCTREAGHTAKNHRYS